MYDKANDVTRIFSGSSSTDSRTNPYAPGGDDQFQLPVNVKVLTDDSNSNSGISFDKHGQINVTFMDQVFDYINVGDSSGIDNTESTPTLTENLTNQLIFAYSIGEDIDTEIEYYKECQDSQDYTDPQKEVCKKEKEKLQTLKDDLFEFGLERSSLDASVALFFGNKTTIGQVCAYANGLEENLVDDVPGFCCLDAPYQSKDWGEKVRIKCSEK